MSEYEERANAFAEKTGTKLDILDSEYKERWGHERFVFKCRLSRNGKRYTFEFGQSLAKGAAEPTMYDILACLQKYDVGTYKDFYEEFGCYDDSVYKAVCKEYAAVMRLFGDVIDELREIE